MPVLLAHDVSAHMTSTGPDQYGFGGHNRTGLAGALSCHFVRIR
jgi:hypothetical protein